MNVARIFLTFLIGIIVTSSVGATHISAEQINSYNSTIQIQENGRIDVTESIRYDFGTDQRHGIYRTIPRDKRNSEDKTYRMAIKDIAVTDEQGNPYQFEDTRSGGELELKIGDPDNTITGEHTYIITYSVSGAITYFSNHDELYWNPIGNEWGIPILSSQSIISLPASSDAEFTSVDCYAGSYGSRDTRCATSIDGASIVLRSTDILQPGEGLTVATTFPKGVVAVLEPKQVVSFWDTVYGKIVLLILILLGLFWYLLYPIYLPLRWYLKGRDPDSHFGKVHALFESPKTKSGRHLTPAETGTLIDEHAGPREVSALIVDLAQRGFLKIVEKKKNEFELKKGKDYTHAKLQDFEKTLLKGIFKSNTTVNLKKANLAKTVATVRDKLYHSLVDEGYFPEHPQKVRSFYTGMTVAAAMTFNFLLILMSSIFGRLMPRKTMEGVHAANRARSLKNFLNSQERQLEFQAKNQLFFEKLLPFAIGFGVEKVWAARFKDIEMKQPDWYVGSANRAFTAQSFTRSMNSSLTSFNKAATPKSSSSGFSSGSGGGGFSGGGGGGGGGGSW